MLLRDALGETLRDARTRQNRTLRDVSTAANVSLGYLSEVERGRKEASSELLASICDALELELSEVLSSVSETIRIEAGVKTHLTTNSVKIHPTDTARLDKSRGDKVTTGGRHLAVNPAAAAGRQLRIVLPYGRTEAAVT